MQGPDADDAACTARAAEPVASLVTQDIGSLRIALAGGYFQKNLFPEASEAVARVSKALGVTRTVEIPEAAQARAAAYVISTVEGASLHLDRLRQRPNDFDPAVRDRLLAGAMIPGTLVDRAQKFRRWYRVQVLELFKSVDVIIAPATPCVAPKIGQATFVLDGVELPDPPPMSVSHTQPIIFSSVFPWSRCRCRWSRCRSVQIIAAPWREDIALRVAHTLERAGVVTAPSPEVSGMQVDLPDVVAEVSEQFARYEELVTNDIAVLGKELFRNDPLTRSAMASEKTSMAMTRSTGFPERALAPAGLMRRTARY